MPVCVYVRIYMCVCVTVYLFGLESRYQVQFLPVQVIVMMSYFSCSVTACTL